MDMAGDSHTVLAFIDAPDPDNFVLLIAIAKLFPNATMHVILTGRPVRFKATREHQHWDYDRASSIMAQEASAARIKNFLRHFGVTVVRVYDGGIAPRTLVPHWLHFRDYYQFLDADPLAAIRYSDLDGQEEFVKALMLVDHCDVVVGGPMTGLAQLITRHPAIAPKIREVHAMFATWGNIQLMQLDTQKDAPPRGALQFNVACDPVAAHQVLMGLDCPIYLMPSEVTRDSRIGFQNAVELREALPQNNGSRQLHMLYAIWYDAAVAPRQAKNPEEKIFIHDVVAALSLDPELRTQIYDVVPINIPSVPHLARDAADWGKILMSETTGSTKHFAAKGLKPDGAKVYLDTLRRVFA